MSARARRRRGSRRAARASWCRGCGTIHGFWASSHASAIWAGVACFRWPISRSRSTTAWFAFRASGEKRGTPLRKSVLSNVVVCVDLAGEEAPAERAERHEADAELLERRQHLRFRLAPPERVLALQRGYRLRGVSAADRLHAGLGQPEVPDLPFANQILDRARRRPRSARLDRRGADRRGRWRRFAGASAMLRRPPGCVPGRLFRPCGSPMAKPNFVAITTRSRTGASASPSSSSLVNGP